VEGKVRRALHPADQIAAVGRRLALAACLALGVVLPAAAANFDAPASATSETRQVQAQVRAGKREDARVAAKVAAALVRQPTLSNVTVDVHAGVATLGGTAIAEADRDRAEALAKQVTGVVDVVNGIRLDATLGTRFTAALDQAKGKLVRMLAMAPLLVVAIAIVLLAWWIGHLIGKRPARWLRRHSHNPYMDALVRRVVQWVVLLLGVLLALDLLGATALVGAVLGSAGVVGLAFGFAFKDIAENYIAGILLSLRRPFAPGDHLVIDKYEGKVVALTSRATILMTLDGNQLSLPNSAVFKSVVLNYSANPKRRFDFSIPIDPSQSIRQAQQLAMAELGRIDGVLADPAPSWVADGYVGGGITLKFLGWIDQRRSDLNKVRSEALRAVKGAFAKAGIEGPRSVQYVVSAPAPAPTAAQPVPAAPPKAAPEPEDCGDTSVNRDIDAQLAEAQEASDERNLLDDRHPPEGATPERTP